jgi:intein/homing endonuclease
MKIPLQNYLLKLDEKKYIRKGSDSIRVYKIGNIIKRVYTELKKFKSITTIERESKRCHQTYSIWILEKGGTSIRDLYRILQYWKSTCKKTNRELNNLWEEVFLTSNYFGCVNGKQIKLPKYLDNKLAYLLGVIMGDGHLANPDKSYDKLTSYNSEIRITDGHKETFVKLSTIFEELFDYKPKIYSELSKTKRPFYRIVIKSKPMHRFLMNICQIPTGKKFDKVGIPQLIKNSHLELQKSFITGFFDADGCLRLHEKRFPMVVLAQSYPRILHSIIDISKKINVKWSGPYEANHPRNQGYQIKITNKENVERFLNEFPSFNPIKIKQSEILWKILKSRPTSQSRWMEIGDGERKIKGNLSKDTFKV